MLRIYITLSKDPVSFINNENFVLSKVLKEFELYIGCSIPLSSIINNIN